MKYGYRLDKEQGIYVEDISLFDYRKQGPTVSQRMMLEAANPHLFNKVKSGGSALVELEKRTPDYIQRTPEVLLEPGFIVEGQTETSGDPKNFQPIGLAKEFSQLKNKKTNDILAFANKYGLLGCKLIEYTNILETPKKYMTSFSYHHSYFEPLKVWEWHIDHINKLFQLYRALRYKTTIENDVLRVEILPRDEHTDVGGSMPDMGMIYWKDGTLADYYSGAGEVNYTKMGRTVLINHLSRMIKGAIDPSYDTIIDDEKSELGFRINETPKTSYLLAAIYYDMWQIIKNHQGISICEQCGAAFTPSKRRKHCDDACKQAAYRKRKTGIEEDGGKENAQHSAAR